jgi:hypothetical protein
VKVMVEMAKAVLKEVHKVGEIRVESKGLDDLISWSLSPNFFKKSLTD